MNTYIFEKSIQLQEGLNETQTSAQKFTKLKPLSYETELNVSGQQPFELSSYKAAAMLQKSVSALALLQELVVIAWFL